MRFILTLMTLVFLSVPSFANDGIEKITMPKTGWPSDYDLIRAQDFFAQERYEDALDVLEDILDRNVESAEAHALSGYIHFKLNNIDRAEKHLFSVIDVEPRHLGAHLYLAEMDLKQDKIKKVEERLQLLKLVCKGTDCAEYQYLKRKLITANKDK